MLLSSTCPAGTLGSNALALMSSPVSSASTPSAAADCGAAMAGTRGLDLPLKRCLRGLLFLAAGRALMRTASGCSGNEGAGALSGRCRVEDCDCSTKTKFAAGKHERVHHA